MRIIFARHGESEANVARIISNRDLDHPLTLRGREQAGRLATQLVDENIIAIYASPILRAQETAQIIGAHLHKPVTTVDALREIDCGVAEGRGDAEAWQAHDNVLRAWDEEHDYDQRIEGGESFNDVCARFLPFVEHIIDEYGERSGVLLCITHGSLLTQMLPLVLANIDRESTAALGLANCVPVAVVLNDDQLVCAEWGDHRFVAGLRP